MSGVVKKKKKTLLAKGIEKLIPNFSNEQEYISSDVPLGDARTNDSELIAIESRRDELRAARHGNTDAAVTFNGNA